MDESKNSKKKRFESKKVVNQVNMEKLEETFGTCMEVHKIWECFKKNKFDMDITVAELKELFPSVKTDFLEKKYGDFTAPVPSELEVDHSNDSEVKKGLRTSEDVYNRIKWDPDFDKSEFIIGYEDRFVGIMEAQFSTFKCDDVTHEEFVPWHRVQYFKRNDIIVWDRKTRKDDIFDCVDSKSEEESKEISQE